MNKYVLLFSMIACTACAGNVSYCADTDSESYESTDSTSTSDPECPVMVDTSNCTITYPVCDGETLHHVEFMTHGTHDCKTAEYPPQFCEYVGDVSCNGQIAGVWCCK